MTRETPYEWPSIVSCRSPERRGGHLDTMLEGPVGAVDIWGLGAALEELLGAGLKGALASLQRRMLADKMASRPTAAQLLRHSYFTTKDLITTLAFLETFSLKVNCLLRAHS